MIITRVWAVYFSPTGNTKEVTSSVAHDLAREWGAEVREMDYTVPENRKHTYRFSNKELLVLGMPVYAGRIPNKILPDLEQGLKGDQTAAIPISVYGNRSFDDALIELKSVLESQGFCAVAAAAVVSRHTFSATLAVGRPDAQDWKEIHRFAQESAKRLGACNELISVSVPGRNPIGPYYTPLQEDGSPAVFLKAKPHTDLSRCDHCGICANVCPMGSIDSEAEERIVGICIKCQACIRKCPKQAKHFDDPQFLSHVRMLEKQYTVRKENAFFLQRL